MEALPAIVSEEPDELEMLLTPLLGSVKLISYKKEFCTKVSGRASSRVAMFHLQASDSRGILEPPLGYFGLNLPLSGCFRVTAGKRETLYGHDDIQVARPDRHMSPELTSGCSVLGANIFTEPLRADLHKLAESGVSEISEIGWRIETASEVGLVLRRLIFRLWSESNRSGVGPSSNISIAELEDELITSFVMAGERLADQHRRTERMPNRRAIACAEEYLDSHLDQAVSRADLAAAAGVSIRTLSRGFIKRHGTGPMGFLRTRRFHTAYRQLLVADIASTSVTDIALRYGFNHLGKFAVEYRQAFGESPSVTLSR